MTELERVTDDLSFTTGETDGGAGAPTRVLVVDDHELFRQGLMSFVARLFPGAEVIGATTAAEAFDAVENATGLDLVLLDLKLPDADGFDVLRQLVGRLPDTPVAVVTASESTQDITAAYQAGAKGYMFKSSPNNVLRHALTLVLCGEIYMPSAAAAVLSASGLRNVDADGNPDPFSHPVLTPRQREILALMAEGLRNSAIAAKLNMSEPTVKVHVKGVLQKFGVNNRTHAVMTAIRLGMVSLDADRPGNGDPE